MTSANLWTRRAVPLLLCAALGFAQTQTAVFRSDTNLQSIAVRVTDRGGNDVQGLTAADFEIREDGQPRKIAFFGAEKQPVSLAILLDPSRSMDFGAKLQRARELLAPLIRGSQVDDQIFLIPFTDRVETFDQLTPEQRLQPPVLKIRGGARGTALYDALASALCHMRTAQNLRQAVIVITDGADQHSRLNLDQLIGLTQASSAQIFTIGFFSKEEAEVFRQRQKTVTLVGEHEIDNPIIVFERLAKESGAESFFPSSEQDLKKALDHISAILQSQYTLAYYPPDANRFRKIEVRVRRHGARVLVRQGVGAEPSNSPVHFAASSCEVLPQEHPYPWEARILQKPDGTVIYHEDFSDPHTGWPDRRELLPSRSASPFRRGEQNSSGPYRPGMRYTAEGYELLRHPPPNIQFTGPIGDGVVVGYGPSWDNLRSSVTVDESDWWANNGSNFDSGAGLIFHLSEGGFYAVVLSGIQGGMGFKVVKWTFADRTQTELVPWTTFGFVRTATAPFSNKPPGSNSSCTRFRLNTGMGGSVSRSTAATNVPTSKTIPLKAV